MPTSKIAVNTGMDQKADSKTQEIFGSAPTGRSFKRRLIISWIAPVLVMVIVLGVFHFKGIEQSFFTHDGDCEFLTIQAIVSSGFARISIPWSSAYDQSHEELLPFGPNFFVVRNHQLFSARPLIFLVLSSIFYFCFGVMGLYLIPALSALFSGWAGQQIMGRFLKPGEHATLTAWSGPLFLGLTPLLFYGLCFWNMAVAAGAAAGTVWICLGKPGNIFWHFLAGILLALCAGIREELLIFSFLMALWVWRYSGIRSAAGFILGLTITVSLTLILNWSVFGDIRGFHVSSNLVTFTQWAASRAPVAHHLLMNSLAPSIVGWLGLTSAVLAFLPPRMYGLSRKMRAVSMWLFITCAAWISALSFLYPDPFEACLYTGSLLACSPFLMIALFFPPDEEKESRQLRWLALGAVVAMVLICPPQAALAAHWGPRFLLGIMPLLGVVAILSAIGYLKTFGGRNMRYAVIFLLILSGANQAHGVRTVFYKMQQSAQFKAQVNDQGNQPIITDEWTVPLDLASEYGKRALFLPKRPSSLSIIFETLQQRGYQEFLALVHTGSLLDSHLGMLAKQGRINLEVEHPITSRLFHYRGVKIRQYSFSVES